MAEILKTVVITGPTATGKTALAVWLARIFNGEIVSVDSRQVYRGMDIGTGKDLDEYGEVPYHLIDIADPAREEYNLARFLPDAYRAIREIVERNHVPILCGGTALYLAALRRGAAGAAESGGGGLLHAPLRSGSAADRSLLSAI